MSVRERIRQIRHSLGLNQTAFAERIAISKSYLSGMEHGDRKIHDRVILLICSEYSVSEHWLRTGEGEMFSETETANNAKAANLFKSLNPAYQAHALLLLTSLANLQNADKK